MLRLANLPWLRVVARTPHTTRIGLSVNGYY
jgi:hypothetical protein